MTGLYSAVSGLNYTVEVFGQNITIPIGSALQGAISPLITNLASQLNDGLAGQRRPAEVDGLVETGTGSVGDALNESRHRRHRCHPRSGDRLGADPDRHRHRDGYLLGRCRVQVMLLATGCHLNPARWTTSAIIRCSAA